MFPDRYTFTGGLKHRAAYLSDTGGYEVELVTTTADKSGSS